MRIAFSGSHRTGKTTLLEHVADRLPGWATVDEPYALLEEEGYETAERPSIEDFEAQLDASLAALDEADADVLFDRCPADVLAYLVTHDDAGAFDADERLERVREAMASLDLVVFVPIEAPDRVAVPAHEDRAQRAAVDAELERMLIDEPAFEVEVLRVEGDLPARVRRVLARIEEGERPARSRRRPRRS